jgi:phage-related protein
LVQPKLKVNRPGDKHEQEADAIADQVVNMSRGESSTLKVVKSPVLQRKVKSSQVIPLQRAEEEEVQTKQDEELQAMEEEESVQAMEDDESVQTKSSNDFSSKTSTSTGQKLQESKGGGSSMDKHTKNEMESAFGADFSNVRIHTNSSAAQMNKNLGAQAFTHGNDIYFNDGKYNPDSDAGKRLLAHELTHTLQQGASLQLKALEISSAPEMIQGVGVLDLIPDRIINDARNIPGYTLFTVVISYDPLTGTNVERNPINLVQGLLELIPVAGPAIFDKLREYNILEQAFDWVNAKLGELGLSANSILDLLEDAWEEMSFPYNHAIAIITRKFNNLLDSIRQFVSSLFEQLMAWIKESIIDVAEPYLEQNDAWSLLKKIIRYDPLREEEVKAETVEILEDFLKLIGKETELEQMRERGTLQETADWLDTQIGTFTGLLAQLRNLFNTALEAIQPENLPNISDNLSLLATQVGEFLQGLWDFANTVAEEVLKLIKDSLLGWLNSFAADIPGFTLLSVLIGRNPFTDEAVPRTIQNIIRGFMGLIPGGEAKYQELSQSGVIPRAAARIEALIAQLGLSAEAIVQVFRDMWNAFTIDDLLEPIVAFQRILARFGETISRLVLFAANVIKVLIELLLQMMGIPPDMIANIISNAMTAFESIKNDPVGFLMNLLNAIKTGFLQFLNNIGTHLLSGIQNWLFGTLTDAGVQIPSDFSIRSLLGMAMEVLGITVDNVLERLEQRIGAERMAQIRSVIDRLSGVWAFVKDVMERGPIAIWEYIQEQISNLWTVIQEGIMGFIQEKVIQQAIGWLLTFLDVTGIMPVIRGVQSIFNAVMSFVEKLREILEIINSFVAGIAQIASGSIQAAASFLERALADGIPVAISFLARQLGLGDISEKIAEMIENTRAMINDAIDWLINKALETGTAFLSAVGIGGSSDSNSDEINDKTNENENIIGITKGINVDGGHTLKIEGTLDILEVNVYSDKQTLEALLNEKNEEINENGETDSAYEAKSQAIQRLINENEQLNINIAAYKSAVDNAYIQGHGNTPVSEAYNLIQTNLTNITADLIVIGVLDYDIELPVSKVNFETDSKGRAYMLRAAPLSKIPGNTRGSTPTQNPQGWTNIPVNLRRGGSWVRAHMLNHRLHGPGTTENLFPGTRNMNLRDMEGQVERFAKEAVWDNDQVIYYNVDVSYGHTGVFEDIPNIVDMRFGPYDVETNMPGSPIKSKQFTQNTPTASIRITINESSANALNTEAKNRGGSNGNGLSGFFRRLVEGRPVTGYQSIIQIRNIVSGKYEDQSAFMSAFSKFNNLVNTNILHYD